MNKILSILALLLVFNTSVYAQQTPAVDQNGAILITGAFAHLGNGKVIENSAIAFENGKLTIVADATTIRLDGTKNYQKIDGAGKHIYPGFIATNSTLGLVEIGAVRATRDYREFGSINPNLRTVVAYNTDSDITPTVRSNGVLLAQIVSQGGRISAQSSVVELDGWNWEDAAYATDEGIHLNWPAMFRYRGWWAEPGGIEKNKDYDKQKKEFEDFFAQAKAYAKKKTIKKKNLKFEAVKGLFDKNKTLYIHVNNVKTMTEAILYSESLGVKMVIVGGSHSWRITDLLKEKNISVILGEVHNLPSRADADIDQPFKTPAMLAEAGVSFALSMSDAWQQRNLAFQAGHAVGFGLDYEAAVSAITLNPAKIMGIDDRVGSLEVGKDASLIISEGDALDMRTNKITHAFIRGKSIDVDNKQKALYRKFKKKYEMNK